MKVALLSNWLQRIVYCAFFVAVIAQTVVTSWVDEDAFITFRVVDNFVNGFGLRWNIIERVQAYTNPLWMFLHIPLYMLTDNMVVTSCILGWTCLLASLLAAHSAFKTSPLRMTGLFLIPLLITPTNAMYFTSGLEGPLLNAMFAAFGWVLVRRPKHFWFWLSLATSLSMLNRLDTIIIYAPVWAYLLIKQRWGFRQKYMWLGWSPLIAWLLFSLFYYGFMLPNTAPAKLGGHLPLMDYLQSGIAYACDFILADPWSALTIVIASGFFPLYAWENRDTVSYLAVAMIAGIVAYCLYVVYIGGAQLSMRMFSLPAFAVCWLWAWRFPWDRVVGYAGFALLAVLLQHTVGESPEERHTVPIIEKAQIGGIPWAHHMFGRAGEWWQYVIVHKDIDERPNHTPHEFTVMATGLIGNYGFYHGPYEVVIDPVGLSDPLLARLPAISNHLDKVGDVFRYIPPGYEQGIISGEIAVFPAPLAEYYEKIRIITRDDLWEWKRIRTLILFNMGAYDGLLKQYIRDYYPRKIE